jgi:hypothetical protein
MPFWAFFKDPVFVYSNLLANDNSKLALLEPSKMKPDKFSRLMVLDAYTANSAKPASNSIQSDQVYTVVCQTSYLHFDSPEIYNALFQKLKLGKCI